ncbi:MAG: rhodanese-like domain-containing protein [Desulfurobacteriaceae bacterium]
MLRKEIRKMNIDFLTSSGHKIGLEKFLELYKEGKAILLDVRTKDEVEIFSINLGINIPLHELPDNLDKIPKNKLVATFCNEKVRSSIAYAYLLSEGFDNVKVLAATIKEVVEKLKPGFVKKLKGNE